MSRDLTVPGVALKSFLHRGPGGAVNGGEVHMKVTFLQTFCSTHLVLSFKYSSRLLSYLSRNSETLQFGLLYNLLSVFKPAPSLKTLGCFQPPLYRFTQAFFLPTTMSDSSITEKSAETSPTLDNANAGEASEPFAIPKGSLGGDITNAFDIYVRVNDDPERDYCFNVNRDGK